MALTLDDYDPLTIEMMTAATAAITAAASSVPVWTVEVNGLIFTVILINSQGLRQQYQVYAVNSAVEAGPEWVMVALTGLYVDALAEIQRWRMYLAAGGSLVDWQRTHPDGVRPL